MAADTDSNRRKIEAQGFLCLSNDEIDSLNVWLRFTPAITLIWFTIGVWMASTSVLFWLAVVTLFGAILTGHPFDVFYNHGIRYLAGSPEIPPFTGQRRFAYLLGAVQIATTFAAFFVGFATAGYVLGIASIGAAAVYVVTGVCAPSLVYNRFIGKDEGDDGDISDEKKFESISPLWPK